MIEDDPRRRPPWPEHPGMSNYPAAPHPGAPQDAGGPHTSASPAPGPRAHGPGGTPLDGDGPREAASSGLGRRTSRLPPLRGARPPDGAPGDPGADFSGTDFPGADFTGTGSAAPGPQGSDPFDAADADAPTKRTTRRGRRRGAAQSHSGRRRVPRKITVTRVAAMRSRQLTAQGIDSVRRAANADGADKSGLTSLIWAYMANFACDAALTVALANTLFFSAATGESKAKVALYLLVTLAPFAVIAPLIGPALDRLQRGRRIALASSYAVRIVLAIILALNFDSWVLYPAALGMLVMSKSFAVLKSAIAPRLLPPEMDLVRLNSRLQVFGLVGGTTIAGALAGVVAFLFGSAGALWLTAAFAAGGVYLSMRIPSWVEVTEGEVATTLSYHGTPAPATDPAAGADDRGRRTPRRRGAASVRPQALRQPLGHNVLTGLWGTGTIKILIGFMFLYIPFVAKVHADEEGMLGLILTGSIAIAAGGGNIAGNAVGARLKLTKPAVVVVACTAAAFVGAAFAAGTHVLLTVAIAALVGNVASALSKVSLDAAIQKDLPDRSRASAFGLSETILQLSWVLGGAFGVLLPTDYWIGFTVVSCILAVGLLQTALIYKGRSAIPALRGRRPDTIAPEAASGFGTQTRSLR